MFALRRLATVCVLISVGSAARADDGPPPLTLWDCDSTAGIEGLDLERENVKQGTAAVRWKNHPQMTGISVRNVPADWRGYNLLRFWLYNEKPISARFMVLASSENPETEGSDYWGWSVNLDFTGWKEFIIPVGSDAGTRSPRGWDQIDSLRFTASGWGNTPNAEADVLIDDIRLEFDAPRPGPRMTDAQFFENLDLDRNDLAAVRRAVDEGDLAEAKSAFLDHMRSRTAPQWWFDWRDRPQRTLPTDGGSEGWDYFSTRIKVDWTGWRQLTLPLAKWSTARKPIGWHHINSLQFSSTYGDLTPSPETVLVLDAVELVGGQNVSLGDFESAEDFKDWRGLQPTTQFVQQGKQAGMWSHLPTQPGLSAQDAPHDWSDFEALRLWVYSAAATGDVITLIADSDTPDVSTAQQVMQHIYDGFDLGEDIDWESNKYDPDEPAFTREWTYGLNRFPHWKILGRAYWQTGDERYAQEWIAQMRDWVADNPYLLVGTGNNTLTWRTIEAGIRTSGSWPDALYYFLGSPSLQPDDLVTLMKSWIEHAHHLMRITVEYPEHGGNWVTMECNGLGHLGILFPECRDASLWWQTAVDRMTMELGRQVYPDGAQKELTTSYHQVARGNFVGLYELAHHNDVAVPTEYLEQLERMYTYNLQAMTPEGRLPPLNDAGYTLVIPSLEDGVELFGREDFRWAATGGLEGESPTYTSVAFPYAGQYVMRSGWDADDLYLLFESGPFGTGHQHEDKLSMFVYGMGRVLLTEAGTYSYDRSKYRQYVLGSWAHNTVLVDGQQQHRRGLSETLETDRPLDNLWIHSDAFDAADGVYDNRYGDKRDIDVRHERTVVFVRPDYWIVVDWLHAEERHTYDILWHLNNDRAEQDSQTLAAWGADAEVANLMVTPVSTPGLTLDVVTGRDEPVLGFAPAKNKKPIPTLDYRLTADRPTRLVWVLTPFRGSRPDVQASTATRGAAVVVTIQRDTGTDYVYIAPRGAADTAPATGGIVQGRVGVVRKDATGTE